MPLPTSPERRYRQFLAPIKWLGALLFVSSCSALLWAKPALAQDPERVLTVSGEGQVAVETAIALVRLGVSVEGESVEAVQREVAERSDRIVTKLQELDVTRLQTAGISLFPQYNRSRDDAVSITSVRGENIVQFEVPVEVAGAVLDEAVTAGASRIDSVTFRPTDRDSSAGRDEAIRLAVQDAMDQAAVALEALGLELEGIRSIQVNSASNNPLPLATLERSASFSSDVATPVIGGERTISANVILTLDY